MFNYSDENFSRKEKVVVLFKEYDTLRTEIIGRTAGGYQIIGFMGALFLGLLGWKSAHPPSAVPDYVFRGGVGLFLALAVIFAWWVRRDINLIARRIRELELRINFLCGDTLLGWETRIGGMATGW